MKKKIIIGLSIFALFFITAGVYIILTMEIVRTTLDDLIMLHRVEILRDHLAIQIRNVQYNLRLNDSLIEKDVDTVFTNVRELKILTETCFGCHHSKHVLIKLNDLKSNADEYKFAISRVFTVKANTSRLEAERDNALRIGEQLTTKIDNIRSITDVKLRERTESTLGDIAHARIMIYIFLGLGTFSIAGLALVFTKGFTTPIGVLLKATRRLKSGDLDYKIEGLKDEFGEVAKSFNEMSCFLKENMIKIQRTEQMVVLGELAAGLAHEIKNPLAAIRMSVELLAKQQNMSEEDKKIVLIAVEEIRRIDILIKSLLTFAKPPKPQLTVVDMNDILEKTIAFSLRYPSIRLKTSTAIKVSKDFEWHLPKTMADPVQLQQAFLNLLINAIEAMPHGGKLAVKTFYLQDINSIQIAISDTGKGIDKEISGKIFQPFFTTKAKGTGLGLAITKRFIEQHEGEICTDIKPGKGATFNIFFPIKEPQKD